MSSEKLTAKQLADTWHDENVSAYEAEMRLRNMGYVPADKYADTVLTRMMRLRARAGKPRAKNVRSFTWDTGTGTKDLPIGKVYKHQEKR